MQTDKWLSMLRRFTLMMLSVFVLITGFFSSSYQTIAEYNPSDTKDIVASEETELGEDTLFDNAETLNNEVSEPENPVSGQMNDEEPESEQTDSDQNELLNNKEEDQSEENSEVPANELTENEKLSVDELTEDEEFADEYIHISDFSQLTLIGTNAVADGNPDSEGNIKTYTSSASYYLDNDIVIPDGEMFTLPDDFSGSFYGNESESELYDSQTDTVTIFNVLQLQTLADKESAAEVPVLSGDVNSETFGTGQLVLKNDNYITYSNEHHYVLSSSFTAKIPDVPVMLKAPLLRGVSVQDNSGFVDGRDYFGQTTAVIDGVEYILIGSRQQLQAINSNKTIHVCGPTYAVEQTYTRLGALNYEWVDNPDSARMIYPGDADLISGVHISDSETQDYSDSLLYDNARVGHLVGEYDYHDLGTEGGVLVAGSTRTVYCAGDGNGSYDTSKHSNNDNRSSLTYSKTANYIVFRDIDLRNEAWMPLMFQGTMYGVKTASGTDVSTLWSADKTVMNIDTDLKPMIRNINVVPSTLVQLNQTRLNLSDQTGVGFFGTLSGNMNRSSITEDSVIVKNIGLQDGTVNNPTTKADIDQTLISGTVTALATALGVVLDPVLKLLVGKDVGLRQTLVGLLNARAKDPTSLATGAFAGRIIGKAVVEDCLVQNMSVTTVKTSYEDDGKIVGKGGFVGHVEGEATYDALSNALGAVGDALSGVLNIIPGLGLGDLVTVLLDNALPLQNLIPTGYTVPQIANCTADNISLSSESGKYGVGGFAGSTVGTVVRSSNVINSTLTVAADHFGGGFVGAARDGIIMGTLSGLGINAGGIHPQSEFIECSILNTDLSVTGDTYLGGFAGVLANSYCINDKIDDLSSVSISASGDYVGGFVGYAQLGTLFSMGEYLVSNESLLGTVKTLVTGLLGQGGDQSLLDLGGVASSAIMGVQIDAPLTVSSEGSYVGGIVGRGNGTYITSSSAENLMLLPKYKRGTAALPISESNARNNIVSQMVSVHSGGSFAGGAAGYLTSANVGGLLGDTAGIGNYLGFTLSDTNVIGIQDGFSVSADETCAGGMVGWAVGGDILDTNAFNLGSVTAANRAGGFVGATGPGSLVNGNGLDLTLLGIQLISIDNLLSLVSGVKTTYKRANTSGTEAGFTVSETGFRIDGDQTVYTAGGFAAEANSVTIDDCHVANLRSVTANMNDGNAGGYVGSSSAGGLAGLVEEGKTLSVAQVGQLLQAVPYLVPSYNGCDVSYVDGGFVQADTAGGFAGVFQSGKVNTATEENQLPVEYESGHVYSVGIPSDPYSVNNIHHVHGGHYAGGWGGNVYSGALVSAGGGLSVLGGAANVSLSAENLLSVASVYIPTIKYAGIDSYAPSQKGFSVYAAFEEEPGEASVDGYAGGFIGYGSGVQISYSDVNKLKTGSPTEPEELEGKDGSSFMVFDNTPDEIPYAVAGSRYAGGYIGFMDVGSAASVGGGLKLLGKSITLTNVLDVLGAVVSTIEHSNVYGAPGGFSVISSSHINLHDGTYDDLGVGYSGGYAGKIAGGHIQDGNVELFNCIVGEVAAGGYVGEMTPGNLANVLDESSLSLLGEVNSLASLLEDFVPTIRNSETTCVPCGGIVRAQCFSDDSSNMGIVIRGMAGGYVGHNVGGQIWGMDDHTWKDQNDGIIFDDSLIETDTGNPKLGHYLGIKRENAAIRIRSVYGAEYAGGYAGLMEAGSTAQVGGLNLLGGLLNVSNLLGAVQATYPTVHFGAVYGPLEKTDLNTWNKWVPYVGYYGGFASELKNLGPVETQEELDELLRQFIYGYHVVSGRDTFDNYNTTVLSGCAGGFVGALHSGVIDDSHAEDAKYVSGMRTAGGFVGEMQTKGLAEFGGVSLFGDALSLNLGNLLKIGSVFVPAINRSGTTGYQKGLTVESFGRKENDGNGIAGGYVGASYGGQIDGAWIKNLKRVNGHNTVGGFIGKASAASVLSADTTNASTGFLQKLLDTVISTPSQTLDLLNATVSTIKNAEVSALDDYGFIVDGSYYEESEEKYATAAGGFAGSLEAVVIGERKNAEDQITVEGLRGVLGGHYAGGFFGIADVGSVAQVGGTDGTGSSTSILNLIKAGNISLLDAFRTYIYHASVTGVPDGIRVFAKEYQSSGVMNTYRVTGAAGGFGGGLMNGTVENSSISNLNYVEAPNYSGGFLGSSGKNGGVTADAQVTNDSFLGKVLTMLGLNLSTGAQALDIVGSTITNCDVSGFEEGFITQTTEVQEPIFNVVTEADLTGSCSAGFVGFADVAQIEDSHVTGLKQVNSPQIAGGFIGRTSAAYLVDLDVSSYLTDALITLVNKLLKILYLDHLPDLDLLDLGLGDALNVKLLADGNVLFVNLGGIKIGVSLSKNDPEYGGNQDAVIITLGSSTIKLPCDEENGVNTADPNISVSLIEGNRTSLKHCTVTGINDGFNVYGGGADFAAEGSGSLGYAGGFVGLNDNGYLSHDELIYGDIIRGAKNKTGSFSGTSIANSRSIDYLEGTDNWFSIYREPEDGLDQAVTASRQLIATAVSDTATGTEYSRYRTKHYDVIKTHSDLDGALMSGSSEDKALEAYKDSATAVLMKGTDLKGNNAGETPEPDELKDPCDIEFNLTLKKIWNDTFNIANKRPDSVTVKIVQIDNGEEIPDSLIYTRMPETGADIASEISVELRKAVNSSIWNNTWKAVAEGLPIAYHPGNDESLTHYYKYYVYEENVPGYYAEYEYDSAAAAVTVRNTIKEKLPALGGTINYTLILILGILIIYFSIKSWARNPVTSLCLPFRQSHGRNCQ